MYASPHIMTTKKRCLLIGGRFRADLTARVSNQLLKRINFQSRAQADLVVLLVFQVKVNLLMMEAEFEPVLVEDGYC